MTQQKQISPAPDAAGGASPRVKRARTSLYAVGEPMIWLTGGALLLCIVMIVGLLILVFAYGISTFWPLPVVKITTLDGGIFMGEVTREETYRIDQESLAELAPEAAQRAPNAAANPRPPLSSGPLRRPCIRQKARRHQNQRIFRDFEPSNSAVSGIAGQRGGAGRRSRGPVQQS